MISDKYRCVFIHIPKVAGQSVEHFFLQLHGLSWAERSALLLRYNPDPVRGPERLAHLTASEYVSGGFLTADKFEDYFKFSFVRNPWARLVSEYRYRPIHRRSSFKDFVTRHLPKKDAYSDAYRHILPQYSFLHDSDGKCIVDFVGRFESLQTDFDRVCAELGVSDSRLPHVNSSENRSGRLRMRFGRLLSRPTAREHYTTFYDDELISIVGEMYRVDVEAFGFEFEK